MADYYTLLTNAGIAYETACKAAGQPIKLSQISVGDGAGAVYNPAATDTALKREVWRGPLNALFQDEKNPSWLLAEVTIPPDVGGWYVREAGIWTDTGILYAIVKYPESFKPVLATSGSGKEFYIRSIFETSNAALVTLLIDDSVVKATRAWVTSYVADELSKLDAKQSVRTATTVNVVLNSAQTLDGVAVVSGDRVLVKNQTQAKDNGIYVVANGVWARAKDADSSLRVTSGLLVSVEQGTTLADTIWQLVTDGTISLGSTPLTFQNVTFGFAPLKSPVFLDNPTAPTAVQFDSSKSLATTEFAQRAQGSYADLVTYPGSVDLTASDVGKLISPGGSDSTITLPDASTVPQGAIITILAGLNGATFKAKAGQSVVALNGAVGPFTQPQSTISAFRRLNNGAGWTLEGGDGALKYSSMLTGPNWVTPPLFDSGKSFATTEFVQKALNGYSSFQVISASRNLALGDIGALLWFNSVGSYTLNLLAPSVMGVPNTGASFTVFCTSVGGTIAASGGATIQDQSGGLSTSYAMKLGQSAKFVATGPSQWTVLEATSSLGKNADFNGSFGANGYQKLPSGYIEQWGTAVTDASGKAYVSFTTAFPNALLNITPVHVGSLALMSCVMSGSQSKTGCTLLLQNQSGAGAINWVMYWRAIGY
jgi:hypothetical protein